MTSEPGGDAITTMLNESRLFPPPAAFSSQAHVDSLEAYEALWNRAKDDPEGFWGEMAGQLLDWSQPWDQVLDWQTPFARWFVGGKLNASANCVDRHCAGPRKNKAAIIWEGEPGERRVLRYQDLQREVARFANVLKGLGVKKGEVVAIYMPMVPELAIAVLACADRRASYRCVRRVLLRGARGPDSGLWGQGSGHGRWRLSTGQGRSPQGARRRRRGDLPDDSLAGRASPDRRACGDEPGPGPLVA